MTRKPASDIDTMADLRVEIDAVDDALIDLLAARWSYTERAATLKAREGIAAAAPARARAVLDRMRDKAAARGIDADMIEAMWQIMIDTVIAREVAEIGTEGKDA